MGVKEYGDQLLKRQTTAADWQQVDAWCSSLPGLALPSKSCPPSRQAADGERLFSLPSAPHLTLSRCSAFITSMSAAVTDIDGGAPGHHLYLVSIALGLASKQGLTQFPLGIGMASWINWSSQSREGNHVEEALYNTPCKPPTSLCGRKVRPPGGGRGRPWVSTETRWAGGCRQV